MFKYYINCDSVKTLSRIKRRLEYYNKKHFSSRRRLFILTEDIDFPLNLSGAVLYRLVDEEEFQHMRDILEKEGLIDYIDGKYDDPASPN